MTITATHLAQTHRVGGGLGKFHALFLVTAVTHLCLGDLVEDRIMGCVDFMATDTGDFTALMGAALPVDVFVVLMALQADAILHRHGLLRLVSERDNRRALLAGPDLADVTAGPQRLFQKQPAADTRPVTGLTLQSGKRRARITFDGMFGFENVEYRKYRIRWE